MLGEFLCINACFCGRLLDLNIMHVFLRMFCVWMLLLVDNIIFSFVCLIFKLTGKFFSFVVSCLSLFFVVCLCFR